MLPRPLFEELARHLTGQGFKILLDLVLSALIADPDNALVRAAQQRAGVPSMPATGMGTSI